MLGAQPQDQLLLEHKKCSTKRTQPQQRPNPQERLTASQRTRRQSWAGRKKAPATQWRQAFPVPRSAKVYPRFAANTRRHQATALGRKPRSGEDRKRAADSVPEGVLTVTGKVPGSLASQAVGMSASAFSDPQQRRAAGTGSLPHPSGSASQGDAPGQMNVVCGRDLGETSTNLGGPAPPGPPRRRPLPYGSPKLSGRFFRKS
jgi:hypothetical protein